MQFSTSTVAVSPRRTPSEISASKCYTLIIEWIDRHYRIISYINNDLYDTNVSYEDMYNQYYDDFTPKSLEYIKHNVQHMQAHHYINICRHVELLDIDNNIVEYNSIVSRFISIKDIVSSIDSIYIKFLDISIYGNRNIGIDYKSPDITFDFDDDDLNGNASEEIVVNKVFQEADEYMSSTLIKSTIVSGESALFNSIKVKELVYIIYDYLC